MKFFLLLLIITSNFVFAQEKTAQPLWHLTVVDSTTMKGIDKATVSINDKYYATGASGTIDINKILIDPKKGIRISCIGYKTQLISSQRDNMYPDTIRLSSSPIYLKEVSISPINILETKIGDIKRYYNVHRVTKPNSAYAQFIPNDKNIKGTITSIEYTLNDELHGIEMPFRVRLFTKMKDSLSLDKELTSDSIIVYNPEKKRKLAVDISRFDIQLPKEGVIAVFEILSPSYYRKDSIWYRGREFIKTPGIDMDQTKNYWGMDHNKLDRKGPYSMVGPEADRWNWDGIEDQWYVYVEGNNFAITITVSQ